MPFDRLVKAVDAWAASHADDEIFAQIGTTPYVPKNMKWAARIDPSSFRERIETADVVVAHAGMGTILTALECGTPILVMPRRASFRETRNDHQVATAERLFEMERVHVAMDEQALALELERVSSLDAAEVIAPTASPELIRALAAFIGQA